MDAAPYLLLAFSTYAIGAASPGPANLAIMATSMEFGRPAGLTLTLGIISGSLAWGIVAALGLGALLQAYATAVVVLKVLGGLYLLWLAYGALRNAIALTPVEIRSSRAADPRAHVQRGLAIALTNPKAIFVWTATLTLGLPPGTLPEFVLIVLAGCAILDVLIFVTYALVFSTAPVIQVYHRLRRWISAALALFFGAVGLRLLLSARNA